MSADELQKRTLGALPRVLIDHLPSVEIDRLRRAGAIIADPKRRRSRQFDGRLLTAADLSRDQDYFIARQADLTRAGGAGVLHGLMVERLDETHVQIGRGNGISGGGQLVVVPRDWSVDLSDVAEMQRLDQAFGLDATPNEPPRSRTGLFVLALRPVEFTANPIAAYPSSVSERRAVDDGEIVEGVALTLIPYRDDHTELDPEQQRAYVAGRVFVARAEGGTAAEALPIAFLQLDRGFIAWVDPWLVRREIGAEHAGVGGFGFTSRAVREAHVQQYCGQLEQLLAKRAARGADQRLPASEVFRCLPPAGLIPAQAIGRNGALDYNQSFFPPQVRVSMALVPEDEVAALVEEALLLPPIDLTRAEELDFTSVLLLVAVSRARIAELREQLAEAIQEALLAEGAYTGEERRVLQQAELQRLFRLDLAPALPGILSRRQPVDVLGRFLPGMPSTPRRAPGVPGVSGPRLPREPLVRPLPVRVTPVGIPLSEGFEAPFRRSLPARFRGSVSAARIASLRRPEGPATAAYEGLADAAWSAGLTPGDGAGDASRLWYVRSRELHVAPDAVPIDNFGVLVADFELVTEAVSGLPFTLDASASQPGPGRKIVRYRWQRLT